LMSRSNRRTVEVIDGLTDGPSLGDNDSIREAGLYVKPLKEGIFLPLRA